MVKKANPQSTCGEKINKPSVSPRHIYPLKINSEIRQRRRHCAYITACRTVCRRQRPLTESNFFPLVLISSLWTTTSFRSQISPFPWNAFPCRGFGLPLRFYTRLKVTRHLLNSVSREIRVKGSTMCQPVRRLPWPVVVPVSGDQLAKRLMPSSSRSATMFMIFIMIELAG